MVIYIFFHSSHYVCDGLISHWTNNWILFGYAVNNVHNIIWPAIISHCAHPTWLVSNNSLGPHCSILIWNLTFLTIFTDEGIVVILYALNANMLPVKCDVVIYARRTWLESFKFLAEWTYHILVSELTSSEYLEVKT